MEKTIKEFENNISHITIIVKDNKVFIFNSKDNKKKYLTSEFTTNDKEGYIKNILILGFKEIATFVCE